MYFCIWVKINQISIRYYTKSMHKNLLFSNFSYWEFYSYLNGIDLTIIGGGIVGLSAAISFKEKHKKAKVLILEKGILPNGASTKNAGFACFGSVSELMSDIQNTNENTVMQTVEMRIKGLELLRKRLSDKIIDYKEYGGYEIFSSQNEFEKNASCITYLNKQVKPFTKLKNTYTVSEKQHEFGFRNVKGMILNIKEGQIDTGKMMLSLTQLAQMLGIIIINSIDVVKFTDNEKNVEISTSIGLIKSKKLIVATNGFAQKLLNIHDVKPARAQVLITKPIDKLSFKGTFHYQEGYYYFRNIGNRVLFGGGRNLDFKTETTVNFASNTKIVNELKNILNTIILPNTAFDIDYTWCGIMGIGSEKKPIIKPVSTNVICAVRMGGMGVAIGSLVGKEAAKQII